MGYEKKKIIIKSLNVSLSDLRKQDTLLQEEKGGAGGEEGEKPIFCLSCNNGKDKQSGAGYGMCQDSGV